MKKEPIYFTLYKKLRRDIVNGVYKDGEKMPSKRVLADKNGVSVITAEHVYELLESEGYIESKERSGFYCTFKKGDKFLSSYSDENPAVLKESVSSETGFPYGLYAKTARKVLSDYGEKILFKSGAFGNDFLRAEICSYLVRSRGMNVKREQIVIGSGAEYLYSFIIDLLGRDKIYAAEEPSYEKIEQVYKAKGVKYEMLPLAKNGIKSEALLKTNADVLQITPYRSFPSGVTASGPKRLEYIEWSKRGKRYIIEDDVESEFAVSGKIYDTVFSSAKQDNVIYMNSFSKTVSPALRTAFAVVPVKLLGKANGYFCGVPTFEQYILANLLKSGEFERHINRTRRKIKRGQNNE